jgi:hypothetical protein
MFLYFSMLFGVSFLNSVILLPDPGLDERPLRPGDLLLDVFDILLLPIFFNLQLINYE